MPEVVTDRAEAMLVSYDGPDGGSDRVVPVSRTTPAPARPGERLPCTWCGAYSVPGPGCDSCGSPLSL